MTSRVHTKATGGIPAGSIGIPCHKEVQGIAVQRRPSACRCPCHSSCGLRQISIVEKKTSSFTSCVINLMRHLPFWGQTHDMVSFFVVVVVTTDSCELLNPLHWVGAI